MSGLRGVADLGGSRELLANLTLRELRGKYKRTALGYGWSLLNPLAMMATYSLIFGLLLKVDPPVGAQGLRNYPLFLLCGLLPWTFVSNAMVGGMEALITNANLIKKTYFRREVLVAANVLSFGVGFATEMVVLAAALLAFGVMVLPWLPAVVLLMALLAAFVTGLALALSVLNVYFRDARYLIGISLQLWFYGTPILYPLQLVRDSSLPTWTKTLYGANPMVAFVESFRDVLYVQRLPSLGMAAYLVVVSLGALAAGALCFRRLEGRLAEEL